MIGSSATMKSLGKCSALNAHAAFDVAVGGNMVGDKTNAPPADPTRERLRVKFPWST